MGALTVDKGQIQSIYALAAKLDMVKRGSHEDSLHILVEGVTGKTSIKELTHAEGLVVLQELRKRSKPAKAAPLKKIRQYTELPGGVTAGQQKLIWYLMFQLEKFDPAPAEVQLRARLCGIIEKQFKVTSFPSQPFRFITMEQGSALIEGLKSLTERAEIEYLHSPQYRQEARIYGQ